MRALGEQRYAANDDWDRKIVKSARRYESALSNLRGSKRWLVPGQDGPIWLAVDLQVAHRHPFNKSVENKKTATANTAPSAQVVTKLLQDNISFRSRTVTPSKDAVAAVAGHDLLLDFKSFERAYNETTGRSSSSLTVGTTSRPTPLTYHYRYYVPLLIKVPGTKAKPKPKAKRKPKAKPPKRNVAVPEEAHTPWIRLDIGAGGGLLLINSNLPTTDPTWVDTELAASTKLMLLEGAAMLTLGETWSGFLEFRGGQQTLDPQTIVDLEIRNSRWSASLGLAYIIKLADLEIQPRAGVSFHTRSFDRDIPGTTAGYTNAVLEADDFTVAANLGLTLRYYFTSWFGLHFDVSSILGPGGPEERRTVVTLSDGEMSLNEDVLSTPLVDGISVHFGAGLSLRF